MAQAQPLSVHVMVAERTFDLQLTPDTTVAALRRAVSLHPTVRDVCRNKLLRLIHAGRLLQDEGATLAALRVTDGGYIHVALTEPSVVPDVAVAVAADGGATPGLVVPVRLGFDRLTILGLDSEDIAVLRMQFLPDVERDFSGLPLEEGETETHRLLRMEDEWLRVQPDSSDFSQNLRPLLESRRPRMWAQWMMGGGGARGGAPRAALQPPHTADGVGVGAASPHNQGTMSSFAIGVLMGLWSGPLAFLAIFFLASPNLTSRFKLGLVTGIVANFAYALAVPPAEPSADGAGGGGAGQGTDGSGGWGPGPIPPVGTSSAPLVPIDLDSLMSS